jgi:hypothetical protein
MYWMLPVNNALAPVATFLQVPCGRKKQYTEKETIRESDRLLMERIMP